MAFALPGRTCIEVTPPDMTSSIASSWVSNASIVLNQGRTGPLFESRLKVPAPWVVDHQNCCLPCALKTCHGVWVGYKCQRESGSRLVRGNVNMVNSVKISKARTQSRSYPGTTSVYNADVAERSPWNLSYGFDNAFIQQEVPIYNLGAVLLPGPDGRVLYESSLRSFFESV